MRYTIRGRVINVETGDGIGGVRVEAWDKDLFLDDHLATTRTITDGSFGLEFDEGTFREFFLDRFPDVFFRVYCFNQLLASTEDSVLWNVRDSALAVEIPAILPDPPAASERHVYLKIERFEDYSTVKPQDKGRWVFTTPLAVPFVRALADPTSFAFSCPGTLRLRGRGARSQRRNSRGRGLAASAATFVGQALRSVQVVWRDFVAAEPSVSNPIPWFVVK